MKKFTIMTLLLAFVSTVAFAQKTGRLFKPQTYERLSIQAQQTAPTRAARAATLVTVPDGVEVEDFTLEIVHALPQQSGNVAQSKKMTAYLAFSGTDVYLQGLAYWFPEAYVKGTLADGKVTVPSGQLVGQDQYGPEYLLGYVNENDGMVTKDIVFNYDAATRTLTFDSSVSVAEIGEPAENGNVSVYVFLQSATYTPGGLPPLVAVEVPEGLQTTSYVLTASRSMNEVNGQGEYEMKTTDYETPVQVGFDGDDLYIQGIVENVKTSWAKATKNAQGKYVIPQGQYIGTWSYMGITNNYFLSAISRSGLANIQLTLNTTTNTLSTTQSIAATGTADQGDAWFTLNSVKIIKIEEREATPKAAQMELIKEISPYGGTPWYYAELFIPLTDTNDLPMMSDKLSYVFLADKGNDVISPVTFKKSAYYMLEQDMTELPYNYTDRLDISHNTVYFEKQGTEELKTWVQLGIQTIYRGNDVEHRSEINWQDVNAAWGTSGIQDIKANNSKTNVVYNLSGQRVNKPAKGLYIVNGRKIIMK